MKFKMHITVLILAFVLPGLSAASDKWTTQDKVLEISWQVLHFIDWGQTRHIAKHPDEYYECETVYYAIGSHPDTGQVDFIMGLGAVAHPIITHLLPRKARFLWTDIMWYPRTTWQSITIITTGRYVVGNAAIGIKMDF